MPSGCLFWGYKQKSMRWLQHFNSQPCVHASLQQPPAGWSVMHPEQPRTGLALQKCQADSSPQGTQHTGLLRCLTQNARPLRFCSLLPRVRAAEVAAPQMSSTTSVSSSSTSPAATPFSSVSTMHLNMGKPEISDTGWDRIKDLFEKELVFFFDSGLRAPFLVVWTQMPKKNNAMLKLAYLLWTENNEAINCDEFFLRNNCFS